MVLLIPDKGNESCELEFPQEGEARKESKYITILFQELSPDGEILQLWNCTKNPLMSSHSSK